ncbi:hypothetical protein [Companilactobacillus keshanensis]|nr:hypothetical protein [Companilactobacillus keshanensis]
MIRQPINEEKAVAKNVTSTDIPASFKIIRVTIKILEYSSERRF